MFDIVAGSLTRQASARGICTLCCCAISLRGNDVTMWPYHRFVHCPSHPRLSDAVRVKSARRPHSVRLRSGGRALVLRDSPSRVPAGPRRIAPRSASLQDRSRKAGLAPGMAIARVRLQREDRQLSAWRFKVSVPDLHLFLPYSTVVSQECFPSLKRNTCRGTTRAGFYRPSPATMQIAHTCSP